MSREGFVLDLAKLVISAAWADGELANDEVNALKDLLFRLEEVSGADWSVLRMYMESPVSEGEREELLGRVLQAIRSDGDKRLALEILETLFRCDGDVTVEEEELLEVFRGEISGVSTGVMGGLTRTLKFTIQRRQVTVAASCLRE
ncbi:MAG: tellurite resistance TerB family protein, partial [Planctomycetota bacterium]